MKKVLLLVCTMFFGTANANMINIELDNVNPSVGDTVSVNINMIGITEDFTAFFAGLNFDSSLFAYVDGSASSDFPLLDYVTFSGLDVDTAAAGLVSTNLYQDFLAPVVYGAGNYLVATFDLLAIGEGQSSFSLVTTTLFGENDFVGTSLDTSASATSIAVPAPGSMALMGLAGLALFGFRRKA